jgi:hypothetical protein
MRKLVFTMSLIMLLFASCNYGQPVKLDQEGTLWIRYIIDNKEINKEFNRLYPDRKHGDVFKLIVDRRNHFVRVSIYQIKNLEVVLTDLPYSIEKNGNDTFLFYNGMEFINDRISKGELIKRIGKAVFKGHETFSDPKILQFDINLEKQVKFNYPPVNPYDIEIIDSSEGKFPKIK